MCRTVRLPSGRFASNVIELGHMGQALHAFDVADPGSMDDDVVQHLTLGSLASEMDDVPGRVF